MDIEFLDDVFNEDLNGKPVNSFLKSKGFFFIAAGVGLFALWTFYKGKRTEYDGSYNAGYAVQGTYSTDSVNSGSGGSFVDTETVISAMEQAMNEQAQDFNSALNDLRSELDDQRTALNNQQSASAAELEKNLLYTQPTTTTKPTAAKPIVTDVYSSLSQGQATVTQVLTNAKANGGVNNTKVVNTGGSSKTAIVTINSGDAQKTSGERINAIEKMAQNSANYSSMTAAQQAAARAENQKLGASIGATYDSSTGKWYTDSSKTTRLYSTSNDYDYGTKTYKK